MEQQQTEDEDDIEGGIDTVYDFTTYLILSGESELIEDLLKVKNLPYTKQTGELVALRTRNLEVHGELEIIQYIDERFPMPQLISGDIDNKARIRMVYHLLKCDPEARERIAASADPYALGAVFSLIDLLIYRTTGNQKYSTRVQRLIDNVT